MSAPRPNPDTRLARVQAEEPRQARGQLKIFFGATAGVGKTSAMLKAAHERRAEGVDVVVGWVDTHGRAETVALLEGLEVMPRRPVAYHGTSLSEFDLDGALTRRPVLLLVDELAHTNAPGSRHAKRWQDVVELLDAGIAVYTTINVQHLESLNDVVAQITGVTVRETVPDSLLEQADEVELIDLPPDDLLQRLREGKVYMPPQAEQAGRHFFRKGNLIALRELALRCTADRVDAQMQVYRRAHAIAETWPTTERILVCVSPSPMATRLVRAARRMATRLRAEWIVVYVETPAHLRLPAVDRHRVVQTLRLAEQLGAETVTLSGKSVSEEILTYARTRNVSKIVVGKPQGRHWREAVFGSVVDALVWHSDEIDIYVISGEQDDPRPLASSILAPPVHHWSAYGWGLATVACCTTLAWYIFPYFAEANLIMLYLLGVVVVAIRWGRLPAIMASVLSVAAFDFFFVHPYLTFTVSDAQYLVMFAVMLVVALVISTLTARLRQQAEAARQRERRTAILYSMTRALASARGQDKLLLAAARHISEVFDSAVAFLLPDASGILQPWNDAAGGERGTARPQQLALDDKERGVAQWAYDHQQMVGLGSATLPSAQALYVPLSAARGIVGVLGVRPVEPRRLLAPEQVLILETFASQTALALERTILTEETQRAQVQIETERLRSSLLSSVSHDLRTPLAAITGAASSILESGMALDVSTHRELLQTIYDEAERLNRLVGNLLEMTRLESGALAVHKEWQGLEEVIGAALTRLETRLREHPLTTHLPVNLPLVPLDSILIEQVCMNLLDNAIKYTPSGSPITLAAWATPGAVTVEVADRGPGIAPGDEQRIFEKFYRGQRSGEHSGAGLGLAICRGIVETHGGHIWAANRPGGGVVVRFTLPIQGTPPPSMPLSPLPPAEGCITG